MVGLITTPPLDRASLAVLAAKLLTPQCVSFYYCEQRMGRLVYGVCCYRVQLNNYQLLEWRLKIVVLQ
jgi:hypothetical protein